MHSFVPSALIASLVLFSSTALADGRNASQPQRASRARVALHGARARLDETVSIATSWGHVVGARLVEPSQRTEWFAHRAQRFFRAADRRGNTAALERSRGSSRASARHSLRSARFWMAGGKEAVAIAYAGDRSQDGDEAVAAYARAGSEFMQAANDYAATGAGGERIETLLSAANAFASAAFLANRFGTPTARIRMYRDAGRALKDAVAASPSEERSAPWVALALDLYAKAIENLDNRAARAWESRYHDLSSRQRRTDAITIERLSLLVQTADDLVNDI